jgi:transcriptional regulator GlxA family with amidase domain
LLAKKRHQIVQTFHAEGNELKIAVLAYDGFTDVDLFLPWDFIWRVKVPYGAGYTGPWEPVICADRPTITSYSGVRIEAPGTIADVVNADGVFIVSGDGSRLKLADPIYMASLKLDPNRQRIAAIDSGVLILAALGLLAGKSATTYATVFPELEAMGIATERRALVAHGSIATAGGCLAGLDLAGWLVEGLLNKQAATQVLASFAPVG